MPFFADLPPQLQERVVCSISAAVKYEVPVNIVFLLHIIQILAKGFFC